MKALVALSDGTIFEGRSFGASGESLGEMVFNTSMTGYQEILTDPSYAGQIVSMTYPMIGNYGVNAEDDESSRPQVRRHPHRLSGSGDSYSWVFLWRYGFSLRVCIELNLNSKCVNRRTAPPARAAAASPSATGSSPGASSGGKPGPS